MKNFLSEGEARKIWNQASPHIGKDEISQAYESLNGFVTASRRMNMLKRSLIYSAVVILFLFIGIAIGGNAHKREADASISYAEYVSSNGQIKNLFLSDGTHIFLNSETSLYCQSSFEGLATRDVFLNGEAFFEVAKDIEHPFVVHTAGRTIKVTGTKFNVRSFLDESNSTVTLVEGGVEVYLPEQTNPITLAPGQAVSINEDNTEISLYRVESFDSIGWYKGEFNAYHMSLNQICSDLERRFGVKIIISDRNVADKVFYASFINNEDVDKILNALNMQHEFRIRKQGRFYTIY